MMEIMTASIGAMNRTVLGQEFPVALESLSELSFVVLVNSAMVMLGLNDIIY